jgi:nucleotide-binding universal stress UspA family protein
MDEIKTRRSIRMTKKILVALDDSDNAMRCVEYIAQTFTSDHAVTLFSVVPDTAAFCEMTGFNNPTLTPYFLKQQGIFCTMEDKKKALVQEIMQKGEEVLIKAGFDKERIKKKIVVGKKGAAKEIIEEAKSNYDTVVMGRRGLSGIKEFVLGSVSHKVLAALKESSLLLIN